MVNGCIVHFTTLAALYSPVHINTCRQTLLYKDPSCQNTFTQCVNFSPRFIKYLSIYKDLIWGFQCLWGIWDSMNNEPQTTLVKCYKL